MSEPADTAAGRPRAAANGAGVEGWRERIERDRDRIAPRRDRFHTLSGLPIKDLYTPEDVADLDYESDLGFPGEYPYTRGVHASMYRGRPWTIRQVAGFGQAEDTNASLQIPARPRRDRAVHRLRPPDPARPRLRPSGVRTRGGQDRRRDRHRRGRSRAVRRTSRSTSLDVADDHALRPQSLMAMYRVVGDERGVAATVLTGTLQNDILKEYTAQNEFIFPPAPSVELVVDTMEYAPRSCRASTRSASAATTSARPARRPSRSWR